MIVLGVRRSGTTLLRVILDRSSELAIPDESYIVPQLARRHPSPVDPAAFTAELRRQPRIAELGISVDEVAARLRPGMTSGEAIGAVFETYAAARGKQRWGDKTPLYMQHLPLLERLFPEALYVHLIRDGRDAAVSLLAMPEGTYTRTWAHPSRQAEFACQWLTEVEAGRALGVRVGPARYLEVRYEELVAEPERVVRTICEFAELPFEASMLEYAGSVDVSEKPHHQGLREPPTAGRRDWRRELSPEDARAFEEIAGDLLVELGYELSDPGAPRGGVRAAAALTWYRARIRAWDATASAMQRSPLWRGRHPPLTNGSAHA